MRKVKQAQAKTGDFIDSYTDKDSFNLAVERMEKAASRAHINRKLVYITIPVNHKMMWQVFLLP